jgi:hypothetical protein
MEDIVALIDARDERRASGLKERGCQLMGSMAP